VLANDLVVSQDLSFVFFEGFCVLLGFEGHEVVDAVEVGDDFEVLALDFDFVDLFLPGFVLDLDEVSPVVGLFDSGLYALGFVH
jgi:hypothetical protein